MFNPAISDHFAQKIVINGLDPVTELAEVTREGNARPSVLVDDNLLEESDSIKFLGMYLDRGLTCDNHVESVCSRVTSESCRDAFRELGLLPFPCLYIFEVAVFCKSKGTLAQGRDQYETRGRDKYRSQHHTPSDGGVSHLPLQAGIRFINRLTEDLKSLADPKKI
ncbi:hypothetical protein J6590_040105 [Homalodisca vitripennis]|nr:hypothetical protein J6590_040105 [Homalodisca vitripennis]